MYLSTIVLLTMAMLGVARGAKLYNAFWRDVLRSPQFFSAPMVDQSSLSWRLLVKRHGVDVAFSQMCHARNFKNDVKYRGECVDWDDYRHTSGDPELEGAAARLDRPHIAQLAGDDPDTLVAAGLLMQESGVCAVDLNLGCPQRIAKKGNYGAFLLRDPPLVKKCLTALVKSLDVPITAKVRRLATDDETVDLCRMIESCGVQMLTIHGRRVEENKLFTGAADWAIIRKVVDALDIPVVANGGIETYSDALRCLAETGAAGVMSSEALLENPRLFTAEGERAFRDDYVRCQLDTAQEYLDIVTSHRLPRPLYQVVRSHLFKFLFRFVDAPRNTDVRELLAEGNFDEMASVVHTLRERASVVDFDMQLAEEKGLLGPTSWYYRHRDAKAMRRILSTPKPLKKLREQGLIGAEVRIDADERLRALKDRLLLKHRASGFVQNG